MRVMGRVLMAAIAAIAWGAVGAFLVLLNRRGFFGLGELPFLVLPFVALSLPAIVQCLSAEQEFAALGHVTLAPFLALLAALLIGVVGAFVEHHWHWTLVGGYLLIALCVFVPIGTANWFGVAQARLRPRRAQSGASAK